jgi:hypothetical protein
MQARVRQFSIMMIASLMLFSTTGVAIYHHICGCPVPVAQTTKVSDHEHSCCAVAEIQSDPICCTDENHDACDSEHHDGCKNEVTYLKAPIIFMMPVQELAVSELSFEIPLLRRFTPRSDNDAGLSDEWLRPEPLIHSYVMPPRAGGSLVILLHSIKIPFPEDIA